MVLVIPQLGREEDLLARDAGLSNCGADCLFRSIPVGVLVSCLFIYMVVLVVKRNVHSRGVDVSVSGF